LLLLELLEAVLLAVEVLLLEGAFATALEDVLLDLTALLLAGVLCTDLCVLLACGFLYSVVLFVTVLLRGVCVTVLLVTAFRWGVLLATVLCTVLPFVERASLFRVLLLPIAVERSLEAFPVLLTAVLFERFCVTVFVFLPAFAISLRFVLLLALERATVLLFLALFSRKATLLSLRYTVERSLRT
jgi:hypothetical protein